MGAKPAPQGVRSSSLSMVDVSAKQITYRQATASGTVLMETATLQLIELGKLAKGDVLAAARLAGINAAKQTSHLIPLCHPLLIEHVAVDFELQTSPASITVTAEVKGSGKTGFEMEALTAVTIALLTIYDMCKPVDRGLSLQNIRLLKKSGGKSGTVVY